MKILMVGADGKYAGLAMPELIKRGATVRALLRDEKKSDSVRQRGAAEVAIGDLSDPASLRAAAAGVTAYSTSIPRSRPTRRILGVAMVEAAIAAGVRKFTFSSVIHPSISKMRNHALKRRWKRRCTSPA